MKNCILCSQLTNGSVGAAGYKWSCICQPCKDKEDKLLADRLGYESKVLNKIWELVDTRRTNQC
ncbi:MAG TPA: hypothetical protein PLN39_02525 [Candidatus Dojkabacteria bacterium]|nr:hypothetical protein [Candidatus Dojkabacteria bacterium]